MRLQGRFSVPKMRMISPKTGRDVTAPIERSFRHGCEQTLAVAVSAAFDDTIPHLPVLTGATAEAYARAQEQFNAKAGQKVTVNRDRRTLTRAKYEQWDRPPSIPDQKYRKKYRTPTSTGTYSSRQEWKEVEAGGGVSVDVKYNRKGGQYHGYFNVAFDIQVGHFDVYDQREGYNDEANTPFNMVEVFDTYVKRWLDAYADNFAKNFVTAFSVETATATYGENATFVTAEGGESYDSDVDYGDEVPF